MKTINLKGKNYAPVSARVEQFHKDHKDGSITTETTFTEGYVIVKATITFGVIYSTEMNATSVGAINPLQARTFTGHSYGTVKGEKAFEKLETTAVGRALAFAGYLAGGEIASYDEIENFVDDTMTVEEACHKLKVVTSLQNLKLVWEDLPTEIKKDNEVLAMKDEMKSKLS